MESSPSPALFKVFHRREDGVGMLTEKIIERANRLVEIQVAERRKQISAEITGVKLKNAAQYMLHSSITVMSIKAICEREIETRAVIAWRETVGVLQTLEVEFPGNMAEDLKQFMRESINSSFDELTQILSQNLMHMMRSEQVSLEEARNHAIAKHEMEIELSKRKGDKLR
jgi:hypothetical protein